MRLLLLLFCTAFGSSRAMVDFSNSTLYDVYDFSVKEMHLAKCDSGCFLFAATMANMFDGYPDKVDPYARNLIIRDNKKGTDIMSIVDLAKQVDAAHFSKIPLIIAGLANISVVNRNSAKAKEFTLVLYAIDKETAGAISYEVYDIANVACRLVQPQFKSHLNSAPHIISFISASPYKLEAPRHQGKPNRIEFRLAGFDNAVKGNTDKCDLAYTAGDENAENFPGFIVEPNTPIISLALTKNNPLEIFSFLEFEMDRPLTIDGFVTSPGWNGCRNPHSGGIQTFRTPYDKPTDCYVYTSDAKRDVRLTVYPNLDTNHQLIMKNGLITPYVSSGTTAQKFAFIGDKKVNISYADFSGNQGFLLTIESRSSPFWSAPESYCDCSAKAELFGGWSPADIWADLVIAIDTATPMKAALETAENLVSQFVSKLTTDPEAEFYSRIGVIAASDTAEVVYNLNMTTTDKLTSLKLTNDGNMNFDIAFNAALKMFNDGQQPDRFKARQIVYFLTNSSPASSVTGAQNFTNNGGIIMVNQFLSSGATANAALQSLASDNYYFTNLSDYRDNLPVLCEANCFCSPSFSAFNDDAKSPRTQANRGCYHPVNDEVNQQYARERCHRMDIQTFGALVSIHDQQKEFFVNSVVAEFGPKTKYWIGLQNNGTQWNWEDQSYDAFTDWNDGQPNTHHGLDECAYATQATGLNVKWTAANCDMKGVIYVCETAPCSPGYRNC